MSERILVVDDEPSILHLVRDLLTDEGYEVETADSGEQALELQIRPRLVVLDWMLPGLLGDSVATALRQKHGDDLPIVLVTADGQADAKARQVRAVGCVRKPFDLDDLLSAVRVGLAAGSSPRRG